LCIVYLLRRSAEKDSSEHEKEIKKEEPVTPWLEFPDETTSTDVVQKEPIVEDEDIFSIIKCIDEALEWNRDNMVTERAFNYFFEKFDKNEVPVSLKLEENFFSKADHTIRIYQSYLVCKFIELKEYLEETQRLEFVDRPLSEVLKKQIMNQHEMESHVREILMKYYNKIIGKDDKAEALSIVDDIILRLNFSTKHAVAECFGDTTTVQELQSEYDQRQRR
jgi:hypothetical protein